MTVRKRSLCLAVYFLAAACDVEAAYKLGGWWVVPFLAAGLYCTYIGILTLMEPRP